MSEKNQIIDKLERDLIKANKYPDFQDVIANTLKVYEELEEKPDSVEAEYQKLIKKEERGSLHLIKSNIGREPITWVEIPNEKINEDENHKLRRHYKRHVRSKFVKFTAECGELNIALSRRELRAAKKQGKLPLDLTVHHQVPLSMGGTSDYDNMVIISDTNHQKLNEVVFEPQIERQDTVFVPMLPKVVDSSSEIVKRLNERSR